MLPIDLNNQHVLITGGTRGIGLQMGLTFAKQGAKCILTYRWGDHDEDIICQRFQKLGAKPPLFFQADVSKQDDTKSLFANLIEEVPSIDVFISNVSSALVIQSFEDFSLKGLKQSLSYSTWPLIAYTKAIHQTFKRYPNYIVGISSTGPDHYSFGYDYVAASKTALEVLCRYLSYRLKSNNVKVNAVRSRAIKTDSFRQTFGEELESFANKFSLDKYWITEEELANTVLALCSGYCDIINGQTITVDRGTSFFDNFMDLYTRHRNGELPNLLLK